MDGTHLNLLRYDGWNMTSETAFFSSLIERRLGALVALDRRCGFSQKSHKNIVHSAHEDAAATSSQF